MYFAHPIDFYCLTNFEKKYEFIRFGFSLVWVLVLILILHFIVICKPRTLNGGGEDSVQYSNRKKHCFLAVAILLLSVKLL